MGKISLEIQEENFLKRSNASYSLSMLAGMDRLSYLINDSQFQILGLRNYDLQEATDDYNRLKETLKTIFIEDQWLRSSFQEMRMAISNRHFTIVPERLYNEKDQTDYLKSLIPWSENMVAVANHLEGLGIYIVFAIDKNIKTLLESYFPNARLHHIFSSLLRGFHELASLQAGPKIFLNVCDRQVQILAFDDDKLVFSNAFDFQSSKDFIYYVMLVFDQFKWKPETVPVHLSGHIVEDSQIYHLLYRYIRHISLVKAPTYWQFGQQFGETPRHFFFDLYSLKLCE